MRDHIDPKGGQNARHRRDSRRKTTLVGGILVMLPIYLSILLLLKAISGLMGLVAPITQGVAGGTSRSAK